MTDDQSSHADYLAETFRDLMRRKYQQGAQQHGGNLWEKPSDWLLDQAIDEAIDQVVYLLTLKEKEGGQQ